jgi:hypothetical protein
MASELPPERQVDRRRIRHRLGPVVATMSRVATPGVAAWPVAWVAVAWAAVARMAVARTAVARMRLALAVTRTVLKQRTGLGRPEPLRLPVAPDEARVVPPRPPHL